MKQIVDLTGKKILVTGASSGIGRETAILLSRLGARVVLVGRRTEELEVSLSGMEGTGHHIITYDLGVLENIKDLVREAVDYDQTKLDGLVHCAGITKTLSYKLMTTEKLDQVMRVNFYSFVELARQYADKKNCNGGSIVAISSRAAVNPRRNQIAYGASKAAINASVQALSKELAKKNIRVNSILPGFIKTPMAEVFIDRVGDDLDIRQLLGIGEPADVANMIAYLLSDAAKFITGALIHIDGGSY